MNQIIICRGGGETMYIRSVSIKNFKNFGEQTFELDDRFTLVIGGNGVGKTSVLEALSVGLGGFLVGLDGVSARSIRSEEVRRRWKKFGSATVTMEKQLPCEITCMGEIDERKFEWTRSVQKLNGNTTSVKVKELKDYTKKLQKQIVGAENYEVRLPLIAYHSAGRLFSQKKNKWVDPFSSTKGQALSRFIGYTDCLEAESNIKLFTNWLRRMTLIRMQKQKEIGELNATVGAVEEFMKGLVEEGESVKIFYDFEEDDLMVELGNKYIPLRLMSSGYRSIIGMVADLAFRMSILNPQLESEAVKQTPGVVLIDEIDLHLHPQWQWRVVEDLKRTFPKVQFIATTHAPIVIASCKDGKIIRLEHKEESYTDLAANVYVRNGKTDGNQNKTPYGWQVEDVLYRLMNTLDRPKEVQEKISEIRSLYSQRMLGKLRENDMERLLRLEKEMKDILPEGDPTLTLIDLQALVEVKRNDTRNEN